MTDAETTLLGQMIDGRYHVINKIAEGGMATVYRALDKRLDRAVAIKIMHTQLAQGPYRDQFVERFHREVRSAASIANSHIVQVYDTGEFHGLDYLVMEYVHGINLRQEMNDQVTFSVRETLRIVSQILDGLSSAHRAGVVHRDIKPENILLNDRGHVQITDFGLAKAASQATLSSTGMLLGTAAYLAPEMIEHNQATPQGDLYAVGIMAWEMLAGQIPFQSDNPVTLVFRHVREDVPSILGPCPEITSAVADLIADLCARKVEDRLPDGGEALNQLKEVTDHLNLSAWQYRKDPSTVSQGKELNLKRSIRESARATTSEKASEERAQGVPDPTLMVPQPPIPNRTSDQQTAGGLQNGHQDVSVDMTSSDTLRTTPSASRDEDEKSQAGAESSPVVDNQSDSWEEGHERQTQQLTGQGMMTENLPPQVMRRSSKFQPLHEKPTQSLQRLSPQQKPANGHSNPSPVGEGDAKKSQTRIIAKPMFIISMVIILIIAACSAGGVWWYYWGPGSYWTMPKPSGLACKSDKTCAIRDVSWSLFASTLKVAGIPYRTSQRFDDTIAKGNIISTNPVAVGDRISKRSNGYVQVVVSRGIKQVTIPKDISDPHSTNGANPIKALEKAGFNNIDHRASEDEYSLDLPAGAVQSINPQPGTRMDHNKKVTLILSKGPMPVSMPDVVGKSRDQAQTFLNDAKLKVTYSEQFSDTVASGTVISSSVGKGSQLHWGDPVEVVVSKGPQTVTMPDVRNTNEDEARKTLEALGLKVKISAPIGDLLHQVRFQNPDPGIQVRLRDVNGNSTEVTLTVF